MEVTYMAKGIAIQNSCMSVYGYYTKNNQHYVVALLDEDQEVDAMIFDVRDKSILTGPGYRKDRAGALEESKDRWF